MRMRAHVDALAEEELGRAHLVPEDERADHLAAGRGQRAADLEAAEVAGAGHDHGLDRIAGEAVAGLGILRRLPAHVSLPGSSGAVPVGWPAGPMVIFSIRASARLRSPSQCFFSASPRS